MTARRRLDLELLRRGLATNREQAQSAIEQGQVLVGGSVADKPSRLVNPSDPVTLAGPAPRFVSRGGLKLDAALDHFALDVAGRRALDAGASTGGFTDCLLQRGAATVIAVDVGRGQLHERLARDPRVQSVERTNIRHFGLDRVGGQPFDLVVADLSFISLRTVAPVLLGGLAAPNADVVTLIKPQFEAGRVAASAGRGVIRDPAVWSQTLRGAIAAFVSQGAAMMALMVSPVTGADGNVEFLAYCRAHLQTDQPFDDEAVAAVVAAATQLHGGKHS